MAVGPPTVLEDAALRIRASDFGGVEVSLWWGANSRVALCSEGEGEGNLGGGLTAAWGVGWAVSLLLVGSRWGGCGHGIVDSSNTVRKSSFVVSSKARFVGVKACEQGNAVVGSRRCVGRDKSVGGLGSFVEGVCEVG